MNLKGITKPGHSRPLSNPLPHTKHSPVTFRNRVAIDVVGPDGKIKKSVRNVENIMATYGLERAGKLLSTSTAAGSTYVNTMAIGTDSTAAASTHSGLLASTQLAGTFSRSDQGSRTARYLGTFGSDGNASSIREVGIFQTNNGADSMIARLNLTGTQSVNRGASDEIRVSYDLIMQTG